MAVLALACEVVCLTTLFGALGVAAVTDLRSRVVPNGCVAIVAGSGALRAAARGALGGEGLVAPLIAAVGGAVVLLVMLAAASLSALGGTRAGVGGGDVKLLAAVGVWAGPVGGLLAVGGACLLGVVGWALARAAAALVSSHRRPPHTIPLAPAIAIAALSVVFSGTISTR